MSLSGFIEDIREHEKALVLFNLSEPGLQTKVADFFATQNVAVDAAETASGRPVDVAVLSNETDVLAVVDVATLESLLADVPASADGLGFADATYADVLEPLKETTFTSYDREQLFYASREIEDRAQRTRGGTIHAGFQRFSVMANQREVYTDLAARGVAVHAYGVPDVEPPDFGDGQLHPVDNDEIASSWFVVFDGDGVDTQKTALLAREGSDGFYGAWTYDPRLVDRVKTYLEEAYVYPTGDVQAEER